jgi:hypothetical protein
MTDTRRSTNHNLEQLCFGTIPSTPDDHEAREVSFLENEGVSIFAGNDRQPHHLQPVTIDCLESRAVAGAQDVGRIRGGVRARDGADAVLHPIQGGCDLVSFKRDTRLGAQI